MSEEVITVHLLCWIIENTLFHLFIYLFICAKNVQLWAQNCVQTQVLCMNSLHSTSIIKAFLQIHLELHNKYTK